MDLTVTLPRRVVALLGAAALMASCAPGTGTEDEFVVGFALVGTSDDLGYNQAIADGAQLLSRRLPNIRVVVAEEVPEDETAIEVLESLITEDGADLLLPTSFGHLAAARAVAESHPGVIVVNQSNVEGEPPLDNLGTFFAAEHELWYEVGITAGAATTSGRIGFIASFPIPVIRRNVGSFLLGARSVDPDIVVDVRLTGSWCDRDAQRAAVDDLLAAGADVLSLQQDCTEAVLQMARDAGVRVAGYHADGREVAGDQWLTAAVWDWADTYEAIVRSVLDGDFVSSPWNGDWRSTLADDAYPLRLASFGPSVDEATADLVADAHARFVAGEPVFVGPLTDPEGTVRLEAGASLDVADLDALDWVPDGVTGDLS